MIDIHNHFMPFVDDGSKDLSMTSLLFKKAQEQGIKSIFLTPHVNSSVSRYPKSKHNELFPILKNLAKKYNIDVFLGAEIYIPFRLPNLDFSKYTMGDSNFLLIEFSTYSSSPIIEHCFSLIKKGFKVIIAHIERYEYLELDDIKELRELGVFIQVNASSVISKKNINLFKKAILYLKNNYVDFIATDSHDTKKRPPNLKEAYSKLIKLVGKEYADNLVKNNQNKLISKTKLHL